MTHPRKDSELHSRLRKTKAALLAVSLTLAGIAIIALNGWIAGLDLGTWQWVHALPLAELGGILVGAGVLGTLFEYSFRKDQEAATTEQFRQIIKEQVQTIRDAVIEGFAIRPEDLKRVATPQLLDDLATNAMALRLGDEQFARELYADIRDQVINAAEWWHDVKVNVRLSTAVERSAKGAPLFDVTVEWQYTTVPSYSLRQFACVSDRDEFNKLVAAVPSTSTWFMRTLPGMDASSEDCYKLLSFTVDGRPQKIRRAGRQTGQTYSVTIGDDVVAAGKPVRIRHVYRTVTSQAGHRLFIKLPQPSRDLSLRLDYSDTDISHLSVTDLNSKVLDAQIERLPDDVPGQAISVNVPGWLPPKAGLALAWTLSSEERIDAATPGRAA